MKEESRIPVVLPKSNPEHNVELAVFDQMGRKVSVIVNGKLRPGIHEFKFQGNDLSGQKLTQGVYTYQLMVNGNRAGARKLIILK